MAKNKIIYNGNTLIDLTGDTVTADKLLQGYTAHDRSGTIITGTATQGGSVTQDQDGFIVLPPDGSGGGGGGSTGLEYESGLLTLAQDTNALTIAFNNNHSDAPFCVLIATNDTVGTDMTMICYGVFNYSALGLMPRMGSNNYYASAYIHRRTTRGTYGNVQEYITSASDVTNIVTNERFHAYHQYESSYYWRSSLTYKWIAVWAPTT